MDNPSECQPRDPKENAELKKLNLEIRQLELMSAPELEKLETEIGGLKESQSWDRRIGRFLPLATTMVALGGFWFGIHQYRQGEIDKLKNESEQRGRDIQLLETGFRKDFWEKQLDTYSEAVDLASSLANEQNFEKARPLYERFLVLYHGKMVIYEDVDVMQAMKRFVEVYIEYRENPGLQNDAKASARELARVCRKSLAITWNIPLQTLDMSNF